MDKEEIKEIIRMITNKLNGKEISTTLIKVKQNVDHYNYLYIYYIK